MKIAIVVSQFNNKITQKLLSNSLETFKNDYNLKAEDISITSVPGAFEIPVVASKLADSKKYQAILCLGCVIKGDTPHFEFICNEVTRGLMNISITTQKPVVFGILTTHTLAQALERCGLTEQQTTSKKSEEYHNDKGKEFAHTTYAMIKTMKGLN